MIRLKIFGMTCAACSARVERALLSTQGVDFATVNLLTNSARVEGRVSGETLIQSIRQSGYDASLDDDIQTAQVGDNQESARIKHSLKRFIISSILTFFVFYLSTCFNMFHSPFPDFLTTEVSNGIA